MGRGSDIRWGYRYIHGTWSYPQLCGMVDMINLGMDEDEDEEEAIASEGSSKDDPYQVNNLIHDVLVQEEGGGEAMLGLVALVKVIPLAELGIMPNYFQHVFNLFLCKKTKLSNNEFYRL